MKRPAPSAVKLQMRVWRRRRICRSALGSLDFHELQGEPVEILDHHGARACKWVWSVDDRDALRLAVGDDGIQIGVSQPDVINDLTPRARQRLDDPPDRGEQPANHMVSVTA